MISVLVAAFVALISTPSTAVSSEPSLAYANSDFGMSQGKRYEHPTKHFAITVPGDAEIIEREAPVDVSVRSRTGWVMHIQSGPANPDATLEQLAAKLEARYLGNNRPWTSKLLGGPTQVAGVPAYQSLYQGSGSRTRVVILRSGALDMALLFIAPGETFGVVEEVFYSMLSSFQPPDKTATAVNQTPEQSVHIAANGPELFRDDAMGVAIQYPGGWLMEQPASYMVMFSKPEELGGGKANASLQNVQSGISGNDMAAVEGVLQEIMAQLAYSVSDVHHSQSRPIKVASLDQSLIEGRQIVSDFTRFETPFRQWAIALPRQGTNIVHVFTFVAPKETFESVRPLAEQMVQSWTLTPVAR